jgi:hypothetical protein
MSPIISGVSFFRRGVMRHKRTKLLYFLDKSVSLISFDRLKWTEFLSQRGRLFRFFIAC